MPSIGHIAVGMACGRAFADGPNGLDKDLAKKAMIVFSAASLLPDLDGIGFYLGVPYASSLGHRGATHSFAFALFVTLAGYVLAQRKGWPPTRTAIFTAIAVGSHGLLDTLTFGGGYGCALLWPFSDHRFWSPLRFIPISPIGVRLFSGRGLRVMATEVLIFAPFWLFALLPRRRSATG